MIKETTTSKTHIYKGWTFFQVRRGQWALIRLSDEFTTHHNSYAGCKLFIRKHGAAADPDASYELATNFQNGIN